MKAENTFPPVVTLYGVLGLLGVVQVMTALIVLHLMSTDMDWMRDYVSNLANEPFGQAFIVSAFVHGWGNLALTLGLRGALQPGRLRNWTVILMGLAAVGILVAALFPIDPPGQTPSASGLLHRSAASATFMLELAAMFILSMIFSHDNRWRRQQTVSLALPVIAAIAVTLFVIAIQIDVVPGLAERAALAVFLAWELWVGFLLVRPHLQRRSAQ